MFADMADLHIRNSSLQITEARLTYCQEHEVVPHKEETQTTVITSTELDN